MTVSIFLIAYHGDRWLPPCVASLEEAATARLHLILVDNSGNTILDGLDLSAFDTEVLRTPHSMGFAEANNFALVQASHLEDVVLFLNQDTINPAGWIDRCLEALAADASLGAVSPVIRTYTDEGWDPSFMACLTAEQQTDLEEGLTGGTQVPAESEEVVWQTHNAPAPALLVRTEVLREVGPFDPIYGSYYEDYDLCRRIRRAGYRIGFVSGARVRHFSGSTTDTPEKERQRMRQILRNRVIYRLREDDVPRWVGLARFFALEVPQRLGRSIARTPSSQPSGVVLQAVADVGRLVPRLASSAHDSAAWHTYLEHLGWPPSRS